MRNKLLKQHGFTLLEVLIVVALIPLLLGVTYSIFSMSNKTFNSSTGKAVIQKDARTTTRFITKQLRNAKEVAVSPPTINDGEKYYAIKLIKNTNDSLSTLVIQTIDSKNLVVEELSIGKRFKNISFKTDSPGVLSFSLGFENYTLTSAIKLNNISKFTLSGEVDKIYFLRY